MRVALTGAADAGAHTDVLTGDELELPFYDATVDERTPVAVRLVESVRAADGIVVVSPGYHGGISGLVKNALDYLEDLRYDARPYLEGKAVGVVAVAYGWQAAVTTLEQMRTTTHALRGWATPLGGAVNSAEVKFDESGGASEEKVVNTLRTVGQQVAKFAQGFPGYSDRSVGNP